MIFCEHEVISCLYNQKKLLVLITRFKLGKSKLLQAKFLVLIARFELEKSKLLRAKELSSD